MTIKYYCDKCEKELDRHLYQNSLKFRIISHSMIITQQEKGVAYKHTWRICKECSGMFDWIKQKKRR